MAPKSQREREFAILSWAEIHRLESLTKSLATPEEAVAAFGQPQREHARGLTVQEPGSSSEPGRTESYRTLEFTCLSATADVVLVDYGVRGIKWQYAPKYIGTPKGEV